MNTIPKHCSSCGTTFVVATKTNRCPYCNSKRWVYGFKAESLIVKTAKSVKALLF